MSKPELSIVLLNWNGGQVTLDCIASLVKTIKEISYEIILVDNNSKDDVVETVKQKYPKVNVIENNFNNYFAGANNQGYEVSKGKYIFILNSDTIVPENAVDDLIYFMKSKDLKALTCTLLNKDGSVQYNMHRRFPTFLRLITSLSYKKFNFLKFLPSVRNYLYLDENFNEDFYVEQASAASILLSKDLINQLGVLFDAENFPLFYNDVDLSYRINKLGYKILCKTAVKIYHLKGDALKKLRNVDHWELYGNSAIKYFKKHKMYLDFLLTRFFFGGLLVILKIYKLVNNFFFKNSK
jgi:hypothetical protein